MPKISQLPAAVSVAGADLAPIVQGGITKKATYSLVLAYVQGAIQIAESQVTNLTTDLAAKLAKASNLSDVTNAVTALANLSGLNKDGSVAMTGALNMGTHLINNVVDPVSAQDAATKKYVDDTALNGTSVYAASAASLGTVTQSGSGVGATLTNAGVQATFALDGVNPPVGSNVLIKNTAVGMTAANEGIYIVTSVGSGATNWVLTRATSYDTPTEINNTGLIAISNGSTLAGTAWYNTSTIVTVDTTSFSYSQFASGVTSLTSGAGITLTPSTITGTGSIAVTPGQIPGTATNDNATAGNVGEVISSTIVVGSAVSLTTGTTADVTSISLTAGDWDVWGNVIFIGGAATTVSFLNSGISTTTATLPAADKRTPYTPISTALQSQSSGSNCPVQRLSVAGATTVYLTANAMFAADTLSAYGNLFARRRR